MVAPLLEYFLSVPQKSAMCFPDVRVTPVFLLTVSAVAGSPAPVFQTLFPNANAAASDSDETGASGSDVTFELVIVTR